jgi:hypothetical protein
LEDLIDNYYLSLPEPEQSVLLFLHQFFVNDMMLQHQRTFNTPFYYLDGKWFSFIDYNPKKRSIHISFVKGNEVSHPNLLSEGRKQMKIYKINPEKDIDIEELVTVCNKLKKVYV